MSDSQPPPQQALSIASWDRVPAGGQVHCTVFTEGEWVDGWG